jgi:hypothetical protein
MTDENMVDPSIEEKATIVEPTPEIAKTPEIEGEAQA